jgi:hypothetical protein
VVAGHGCLPAHDGDIRAEVEHVESSSLGGRGEGQGSELVVAAGRQPDHDSGPAGSTPGGLEGCGEAAEDGVAGCVLACDVDLPARPALTESIEGGKQP